MLGQCARPTGEFKARELLEQVSPLAEEAKVRVYDGGKCWFAEVKKNRDRLKPKQVKAFRRIEKLYRIPVQLVRVHAG